LSWEKPPRASARATFFAPRFDNFHRHKFRAGVSADDIEKAIVGARDDLQRQITDFKEKLLDKNRKLR